LNAPETKQALPCFGHETKERRELETLPFLLKKYMLLPCVRVTLSYVATTTQVGGRRTFTAAVSTGLSVRLWQNKRGSMLWDRVRTEAVSPPPHLVRRKQVCARAAVGAQYNHRACPSFIGVPSSCDPPLHRWSGRAKHLSFMPFIRRKGFI
jgi:hypothetical protein